MKRLFGQAAGVARRLLALALGIVMLAALGIGVGLWRLSQGPIDLAWLARGLEAETNHGNHPIHLEIGTLSLAWEGWHGAVDRPVDFRLANLRARDPNGRQIAVIPRAEISLALGPLLKGQLAPRAFLLDLEDLHLVRGTDGALALSPSALRQDGSVPPTIPLARLRADNRLSFADLRRLRLDSSKITVIDQRLGLTWGIDAVHLDLAGNAAEGKFAGRFNATLAAAGQTLPLAVQLAPKPPSSGRASSPGGEIVSAQIGPLVPATLAGAAMGLTPLKILDAPISADVTLTLAADLAHARSAADWLQHAEAVLTLGAGRVMIADGAVPIASGRLALSADPTQVTLRQLSLALAAPAGVANPLVSGSGQAARRADGRVALTLDANLDALPFADLAHYWPIGLWPPTRTWVTGNILAGRAHDLHLDLAASFAPDGNAPALERIAGRVTGDDLTVAWLAPLPPITGGHAVLSLLSSDELTIAADAGEVDTSAGGAIHLTKGDMRITGLSRNDQVTDMRLDVAGNVADAVALLFHPQLHLFQAKEKSYVHDPRGTLDGTLSLQFPLDQDIKIEDVKLDAGIDIHQLHLADVLAGRDLDDGAFALRVTNDGLTASGTASLAGVQARLSLGDDFRSGPPDQILARASLQAPIDATALAEFGFDPGKRLSGMMPLTADFISRRNGRGTLDAAVDLTPAAISLAPLAWRKAASTPGQAQARIQLDHGAISGIDRITVTAADLAVEGAADYAHARPQRLLLNRAEIGATRLHGTLDFPQAPGAPYRLAISGPNLDLSGHMPKPSPPSSHPPPPPPPDIEKNVSPGSPWQAEFAIDTISLAPNRRLGFVRGNATDDGARISALQLAGMAQPGDRFRFAITPAPGQLTPQGAAAGPAGVQGRMISGEAHDFGALLRAVGVLDTMTGGTLMLKGQFDDNAPAHPLSGVARLDTFALHDAPLAAKILQGMTLYGLRDELHGHGLGFDRLIAPFQYQNRRIVLDSARMSNASLGFTAKGAVDLQTRRTDLTGTIVPAYFFNSLLGRLPMVGRLFSPERGGGVVAVDYSVTGSLDDPRVKVNPLSALTPGATRGIFKLFNDKTP